MDKYRVLFSNDAENNLDLIAVYIALDSPHKAILFVYELQESITKTLSIFPKKHKKYKSCYMYPYGNYLILYDIYEDKKSVYVLSIIHSAQYSKYKDMIY